MSFLNFKIATLTAAALLFCNNPMASEQKTNNLIKGVSPEDVLPDNKDTAIINGVLIRKGSIAAFLRNIDIIENPAATEEQQHNAIEMMKELAPAMAAIGLSKHVLFKNKTVQSIIDSSLVK